MRILWPFCYIFMAITTCVVAPLIAFWMTLGRRFQAHRSVRSWCATLLHVTRVQFAVRGTENLPEKQGYILMANHVSHLDGPAIIVGLPVPAYFVMKKELARIPLWGWTARRAGFIVVDRQKSAEARQVLSEASARVAEGSNVIIFPEGTRSDDGELMEFKRGGFHLALAAQADIVPVALVGSDHVLPRHQLAPKPGMVEVRFGKPISTAGKTRDNILELGEAVRGQLEGLRAEL